MGAPSSACTCRKCTSTSRTALSSWTGTLTSPKLSEPVHSDRGTSGPRLGLGLAAGALAAAEAGLEGGEQVVALGLRLGRRRLDRLAGRLALDHREHRLAVLVGVAGGVEGLLQA